MSHVQNATTYTEISYEISYEILYEISYAEVCML